MLVLVGSLAITVPVAYGAIHSQVGCLGPCGNNGGAPLINGSVMVTSGSQGVLTVEFRTVGSVGNVSPSITNITLVSTVLPDLSSFEFIYHGSPVSTTNPLPWDQTATGSITLTNVTVGTIYDITCYWHLSNDPSHADSGEFSFSATS